jgi:nitrite reductase/ring-hydroxylating ferredoxin subunit/uncharacterized membrane protein
MVMRSVASIKGHPLHPILICFPIAFLTGTWVMDMIEIIWDTVDFAATARHLNIAGIAFGLLAAIPGIIDYTSTVPKKSSAKKRGAKHGILNTMVIILFIIALVLRNKEAGLSWIALVETLAIILLFIAGWLGGTLVYKNQIGVDIRYANAGKWSEENSEAINGLAEVRDIEKLMLNQMKLVHIGSTRIVVAKTETGYVAFDDRCPHRGGSLAGGSMMCGTVQCPWHGSQFDVSAGTLKAGPSKQPISTYPVMQENGKYYIHLNYLLNQ